MNAASLHQLVPSRSDGSAPAAATVPAASTGTKPRTVDSVETVSTRKGKTAKVRVSVNGRSREDSLKIGFMNQMTDLRVGRRRSCIVIKWLKLNAQNDIYFYY